MNFLEAAEYFSAKAAEVEAAMPEMALAGAEIVKLEAQAELGTYQSAVGPYPAWAQLAQSTQDRRVAAGFTPNDPLLASGQLRESIQIAELDNVVQVGSNIPYAKEHENGTSKIPPRPFLGRAAFVKQDEILEVQAGILGDILSLP